MTASGANKWVLERDNLQQLFDALQGQGYRILGPTLQDRAIVYDELNGVDDLPKGWTDVQEGGTYRLEKRDDEALFGYVVGPHSWKKYLHPPAVQILQIERKNGTMEIAATDHGAPQYAFLGVRACELNAMAIQDRVFVDDQYTDPTYKSRRENAFVIALNCGQAGGTCFCVSMETGPQVQGGFDLALTEIIAEGRHFFLGETGSERGAAIMDEVTHRPAQSEEQQQAQQIIEKTAGQMGRHLDTDGIKDLLYHNYEHPRWDEVATRCLSCANCTMVCPTCFCTTVEDSTDLSGEHAERWRKWDSCFTMDFSYIHGGNVRSSTKARYRQWLTHKLATWIDQFGTSGCVGCGRCITWCPVGIDLTEEAQAIRSNQMAHAPDDEKEPQDAKS